MGLGRSLIKFIMDPKPVSKMTEIEEGRVAVEGIVRLEENSQKLTSPVKGLPCVAYYYKAMYLRGSRGGQGYVSTKLRTAEVYSAFNLEVEGGIIKAIPKKSDPFTPDDHRVLTGSGYMGFKAIEDIISPGAHIRLWGDAKKDGDSFIIKFSKIEFIEPKADATKRKKRKGKK